MLWTQVRGLYTNGSDLDSGWDASNALRMKATECGVNIVSSNYVQPLDLSGCVPAGYATRGCISHHAQRFCQSVTPLTHQLSPLSTMPRTTALSGPGVPPSPIRMSAIASSSCRTVAGPSAPVLKRVVFPWRAERATTTGDGWCRRRVLHVRKDTWQYLLQTATRTPGCARWRVTKLSG